MHKCARLSLPITNEVNKSQRVAKNSMYNNIFCLNTNGRRECNVFLICTSTTIQHNTLDLCECHHLVTDCSTEKKVSLMIYGQGLFNSLNAWVVSFRRPFIRSFYLSFSDNLQHTIPTYNHLCTSDDWMRFVDSKRLGISNRQTRVKKTASI